jgi:hypothetical protein
MNISVIMAPLERSEMAKNCPLPAKFVNENSAASHSLRPAVLQTSPKAIAVGKYPMQMGNPSFTPSEKERTGNWVLCSI